MTLNVLIFLTASGGFFYWSLMNLRESVHRFEQVPVLALDKAVDAADSKQTSDHKEEVRTDRKVRVETDEAALEVIRKFMKEGASFILVDHPWKLLEPENPHHWEVKGSFYDTK